MSDKCEFCGTELHYPENYVVGGSGGFFNFGSMFISCLKCSTMGHQLKEIKNLPETKQE